MFGWLVGSNKISKTDWYKYIDDSNYRFFFPGIYYYYWKMKTEKLLDFHKKKKKSFIYFGYVCYGLTRENIWARNNNNNNDDDDAPK